MVKRLTLVNRFAGNVWGVGVELWLMKINRFMRLKINSIEFPE